MAIKPITVSQFNNYIKRVLETDPLLGNVSVMGEISNLKYHGSGNVFFTLKDEGSSLSCFLSKSALANIRYEISDGMMVKVSGYVSVYLKNGSYSLNVLELEPEGLGSLMLAFEALKEKLEKEGLFDQKHKKELPRSPKQIAVITSETGAAVRDIIKIIRQKDKLVEIIIVPSLVQGPSASADLAAALNIVNTKLPETDVIIIGRGGGSLEELWPFNEEILVRAIFDSKIPVISAVGHETDLSLSDLVADRRAATPSEAADMAVIDLNELINDHRNKLGLFKDRLQSIQRLHRMKTINLTNALFFSITDKLNGLRSKADLLEKDLESLNPISILNQGYAAMVDHKGRLIRDVKGLKKGDLLTLIHKNGKIITSVEEILEDSYGKEKA